MNDAIQKNVTGKTEKSSDKQNMPEEFNHIHELVQEYLKPMPLIVWGSGGTIPFDIPSMDELKAELKLKGEGNLEEILSKITDKKELKSLQNKIFNLINKADAELREIINTPRTQEIIGLFRHLQKTHPECVNIVTTNYDCFLEYLFSYNGLSYTDGYSGREFSEFEEAKINRGKNIINIIKVHGSLRWNEEGRYSYYNTSMKAIYPSKDKYRKAHDSPFRELIRSSDKKINAAESFLIIGFGFNDHHLTPEIKKSLHKENSKIVVVTKHATESTLNMISKSYNFVLLEKEKSGINKTKVTYKKNRSSQKIAILDGNYWELPEFKTMLTTES